jgi:protein-S-isoprenylcysteine O-methyltransferase Ste14
MILLQAPSPLVAGGLAAGAASTVALLRRMRRDFEVDGQLSAPTVSWMYSTYAGHAGATAACLLGRRPRRRSARARMATVGGYVLASAGAGMCVAGIRRFSGPAQVSGMTDDQLTVTGVYRLTRNPQYLGYIAALAGLACARQSLPAATLAAGAALAFAWWVPVEERHLAPTFGDSYRRYLARTPRWLGRAG